MAIGLFVLAGSVLVHRTAGMQLSSISARATMASVFSPGSCVAYPSCGIDVALALSSIQTCLGRVLGDHEVMRVFRMSHAQHGSCGAHASTVLSDAANEAN